ncbi:hypothetical protein MTO96_011038 [Rhipicephalus appendiculatus]
MYRLAYAFVHCQTVEETGIGSCCAFPQSCYRFVSLWALHQASISESYCKCITEKNINDYRKELQAEDFYCHICPQLSTDDLRCKECRLSTLLFISPITLDPVQNFLFGRD